MEIEYIGKCLLISTKSKKILVVGDLHFGFDEMLRMKGVMVEGRLYEESLNEMNDIFKKLEIRKIRIDEVILLGDVKHEFGTINNEEWRNVTRFFDFLKGKCKKIRVIKGNHDKIIEPITRKEKIKLYDFFILENIAFVHGNKDYEEINDKKIEFWVMGHGHPGIVLKEKDGIKNEKYKCYLVGKYKSVNIIIMPSFFSHHIGNDPREFDLKMGWKFNYSNFNVKIVGENLEVLDFGKLKNLEY